MIAGARVRAGLASYQGIVSKKISFFLHPLADTFLANFSQIDELSALIFSLTYYKLCNKVCTFAVGTNLT